MAKGMLETINCFRGTYFFLSNFYMTPIYYKDHWYKSAEHAFMAQKATNEEDRQRIANTPTPAKAKAMGRKITLQTNWDSIKLNEMSLIVYYKFAQNNNIKHKLVQTGNATLIEGNNWGDTFWGMVKNNRGEWVGENNLGKILMTVRLILTNNTTPNL